MAADPWRLTHRETQVIAALIQYGTAKGAGRALDLSHETVKYYLASIKNKMGAVNALQSAVFWDRWRREVAT